MEAMTIGERTSLVTLVRDKQIHELTEMSFAIQNYRRGDNPIFSNNPAAIISKLMVLIERTESYDLMLRKLGETVTPADAPYNLELMEVARNVILSA